MGNKIASLRLWESVKSATSLSIPMPSPAAGVVAGVFLSNWQVVRGANSVRLARIFAAFLAYVAAYNIYRLVRGNVLPRMDDAASRRLPPWRICAVGAGMGLAAGLTGIGGGALAVPLQQLFLRMPLRNAIGNSACTIMFSALIGALYKNATLHADHGIALAASLAIAAALTPSAFVGGWLGARLTHRLPRQPVRIAFVLMLLVGMWRMWTAR